MPVFELPSPSHTPTPASTITAPLIAVVSRKITAERLAIRDQVIPHARIAQAPTASPPAPPTGTTAPKAISAQASQRTSRAGPRRRTRRTVAT